MTLTHALLIALLIAVAAAAYVVRRTVLAAGAASADAARTRSETNAAEIVTAVRALGANLSIAGASVLQIVEPTLVAGMREASGVAAQVACQTSELEDIAAAVALLAERRGDVAAPRGQRVVLTDLDDESFEGFLVHEDEHRVVLEGTSLLQGTDRRIEMAGRQHWRQARVKRVQELAD